MPRTNWWYVDTWVDPKAQIAKIATETQYAAGTPKISFYARTVLLRPVLQDLEEGLHSLIQENTCTCGLRIKKSDNLLAIIESKRHRNHSTLEPEPNPKFRGLVGRRIKVANIRGSDMHPVDVLWDRTVVKNSSVKNVRSSD
jgi:hypothetical protein